MPGGKLSNYLEGATVTKLLGRTHNQLAEAEHARRQRPAPQDPRQIVPKNPVSIEIVWEEEEDLPIGAAVAIFEPVYFPEDRPQTPFEGLRFRARTATTEDVESGHFAITSEPVAAADGSTLRIGHAWIPAAVWAQVDVASTADRYAEPVENEFILESGGTGRFPILWMPEGATGITWCVVLLASSGTGGAPAMIAAFVDCDEPPDAPGGTFKVANPWLWIPPDDPDPGEWDLAGTWNIMAGGVTHFQLLDEDDEPVLVTVHDPLFKSPTTGDKCYIVGPAGSTELWLVERSCSGGVPGP